MRDAGTLYLDHLSDADLAFLGSVVGPSPGDGPGYFRAHPDRVEPALGAPTTFDACFGTIGRADLLAASPFCVFGVLVQRGVEDLAGARWVEERLGPRRRVPVFDADALRDFSGVPEHRVFLTSHLASYTRAVGTVTTATADGHRRRHRFTEVDPVALAGLLDRLPEAEHAGVYRRLGDVALFLTGVFPDHAAAQPLHPVTCERLLRTLPAADRHDLVLAGELPAVTELDTLGFLGWIGPQWYRLAARRTPLPGLARELDEIADRFDQARRFLTLVADRYLHPAAGGSPQN